MSTLLSLALLGLLSQSPPARPPARVGGDIRAPRKVRSVNPEYPADARRAGLAGVVVLECTIDPRGEVGDMTVLRGVPPLTESAMKAVKRWRYEPTLLDGVPVPVIMTVTVNFKMEEARYHSLLGSLDHRNEHIREAASLNLGSLREGGGISRGDIEKAIRALEPLAENDEDSGVRAAAARALSRLDGRPVPTGQAPASPPPSGPSGSPAPRAAAWGRLVDPLRQCDVREEGDGVEIRVPPGAYDLSIELGQVTAPRLMQPVEGDVVAQVTVSGLPEPGERAAGQPRLPYHGAGLLLWQDAANYVRLESAVYRQDRLAVRYALFEVRRDGTLVGGLSRPDVPLRHAPAELRLERKGRDLLALVRQGGEAWREAGRAQVDLAGTLDVGIAAVNNAQTPLKAAFSAYGLQGRVGAEPGDGNTPSLDYDSPPKPLRQSRPEYPRAAFQQNIQGTVLVEILIDTEGRVARSRVLQSVPGLDEAALACVRAWTFAPARKGGQAVATIAHLPVTFRTGK